MRRVLLLGALIVICAGGIAAWFMTSHRQTKAAPEALVPVTEAVAKRQDVVNSVRYLGTVQSIDSVSVQPRVTGQIIKINFKPGEDVAKGQSLFLIDPRPYQAALELAQGQLAHDQAVLKEAQVDLARYQELLKTKAIPEQQEKDQEYTVKQDEGTVAVDQANVDTAKLNIEYCQVPSPLAGRAGVLMVDVGNMVQSGSTTTLVVVTQIKPIYVSFTIPQTVLDEVRQNQAKGALDVVAYSQAGQQVSAGKLTLIDNQVNASTGTVLLQGTFANDDEALWPGEFVSAQLNIFVRHNVVTVPAQSVMMGPDGSYVYVIKPDQTVQRQDVKVAARQDNLAVIDSGLSGDETVVLDGQTRLANGVKVKSQKPDKSG
jgi:membrane fusion protein, multidrug efflux system